jgi:ATP-dependent protease ClpP protease subunit
MPGFARSACIVPLAMLLVACAGSASRADVEHRVAVSVDGATLTYRGPLHAEGVARLLEAAEAAPEPPRTLVITSTGGDIEAGMRLGNWIFDRGLDVHVPEYCISSCANYVFTAGKHKVVGQTALVIWHGGATQEGLASGSPCRYLESPDIPCDEQKLKATLEAMLERVQRMEADFFERIGVTQLITVLGQWPQYDCSASLGPGSYNYIGWYYSIRDLEKLGVNDVSVEGGDWNPASPAPHVKFCRVVL